MGPGKITLDKTFEERDALNHSIVKSIQCARMLLSFVPAPLLHAPPCGDGSLSGLYVATGRQRMLGACSACDMRSGTLLVRVQTGCVAGRLWSKT